MFHHYDFPLVGWCQWGKKQLVRHARRNPINQSVLGVAISVQRKEGSILVPVGARLRVRKWRGVGFFLFITDLCSYSFSIGLYKKFMNLNSIQKRFYISLVLISGWFFFFFNMGRRFSFKPRVRLNF